MAPIPIALQLYSLHKQCEADLADVFQRVAEMGYHGVEFAGYGDRDAIDLRQLLYDHNLRPAGAHIKIDQLEGDELYRTIEFNLSLGNVYLIVPWLPEDQRDYPRFADKLNDLNDQLKQFRLRVGYHSHDFDLKPAADGGPSGWEILVDRTDPRVILQLDTANALSVGVDPLAVIDRCKGRNVSIHMKEWAGGHGNAAIGSGEVPWAEVTRRCKSQGTLWYIVEHEPNDDADMLKVVEDDLNGLLELLGDEGIKRVPPPDA